MTPDPMGRETRETLAAVVRLMQAAAAALWQDAALDGPGSSRGLLGVGVYAASGEVAALLRADADLDGPQPLEHDRVQLMVAAEVLLGTIAVRQWPAGFSGVVVMVCDLVREVRADAER